MDRPWLRFYEPGVPEAIPYPEGLLVHNILEQTAARFPNRPATIYPGRLGRSLYEGRLSYRDLDRAANRFAHGLERLGIQGGDRVALMLSNSPQFLIAFFGALKAGAAVTALNPHSPPEEIDRRLVDCGAETVVTMTKSYPALKQVQANTFVTRVIATSSSEYLHPIVRAIKGREAGEKVGTRVQLDARDYSFKQMLRYSNEEQPEVSIHPQDASLLQYSDDAASITKGAIFTHRSLVVNCLQAAAWRTDTDPGHEVALCIAPFHQLFAMHMGLLNSVFFGSTLILLPDFELEVTELAIEKYRPTVFPVVGTVLSAISSVKAPQRFKWPSIRACLAGGDLLPQELQIAWEKLTGCSLIETYGRIESGALSHANPIHGVRKPGSIGIPLPGTDARIVDPASKGKELESGRPGKLAVKGEQLFRGYWNRPGETSRVLQDGWLVEEGFASMDEDGFFFILDERGEVTRRR